MTPTALGFSAFVIILAGVIYAESVINPLLMAFFISIIFAQPILWMTSKKVLHGFDLLPNFRYGNLDSGLIIIMPSLSFNQLEFFNDGHSTLVVVYRPFRFNGCKFHDIFIFHVLNRMQV